MAITISPDQNTLEYKSKTYQFKESLDHSNSACDICEIHRTHACDEAPCMSLERGDRKNGIFVVNQQ